MHTKIEFILSKVVKKLHLKSIKSSELHKTSRIGAGSQFYFSSMDKYSFCGYDCSIVSTEIGSFCSIASNCEIGGASHSVEWGSTSSIFNENYDVFNKKFSYHPYNAFINTRVGNDVWIGSKALIKAGVTIGHGAVIGMGSVVTKDVPPYEIWAGNPARFIKKRFEDKIIEELLELKWWDFEERKLENCSKYINDIEKFIKELKKS